MVAEQVHVTRQEKFDTRHSHETPIRGDHDLQERRQGIRRLHRNSDWHKNLCVASTTRTVSTSFWEHRESVGPLSSTSSLNTFMGVSTTDMPPLLHSTNNFEHWDIAAATVPSGISLARFAD